MRLLHLCLPTFVSCAAFGQSYTISTFAGSALPVNVPGPSASLTGGTGIAVDSAGNVFIASGYTVLRLDVQTGILTLAAGNGTFGCSGDNGPATRAQLSYPEGLAVDSADNLYIADTGNSRIRKVSNGVITTIVGNGTSGFSGDKGPATSAELDNPVAVAVDSIGNLYLADQGNSRIRKVSAGVITTVAGNGMFGFSGDSGPATSAQLNIPESVAVDSAGNLYIADFNYRVRKVSNGVITTVAGNGTAGFSGDNGPATSAELTPGSAAVDSTGNLYIADTLNNRIRKVSNGVITTVAGNGMYGFSGDGGVATGAQLKRPIGAVVDSTGNLYILDAYNYRIRKVTNGVITTVAGNGVLGAGDKGPATGAQIYPSNVAVDLSGNLYIAGGDYRIRKVSNGVITTIVGNGMFGFSGDNGPAASAQVGGSGGVAVGSAGNLFIADTANYRIREVSNGVIATIAGNGAGGFNGDNGLATSAHLSAPAAVALDSAGNLYIADTGNSRIRKVSNGVMTTIAGNGTVGFRGDNGPAVSAQLYTPTGVAVDRAGNLYIADRFNNRIRRVSNGIITTIAGNGKSGFSGDNGPATSAQLSAPTGVAVDSAGNLYIADTNNNCIRKVSNAVITTVAGNGKSGFSGDNGPATSAQLSAPEGVAVDSTGKVYIADSQNLRVRVLTPTGSAVASPSITAVTNAASDLAGPITPSEIVVIRGSGLGPSNLVTGLIADPVVTFDGVPADLIYAEATHIAASVPYEVAGKTSALVQVQYQDQVTSATTVPVAATAPGLFTLDGSGSGQGIILNQDGSTNSPGNPAAKGSTVSLFATGTGVPQQSIIVGINSEGCTVTSAVPVPGLVGLIQISVQVRNDTPSGSSIPVVIEAGGTFSQPSVTIAIQ